MGECIFEYETRYRRKADKMRSALIFLSLFFLGENLSARLPDLIPYRKGKLWGYCDSTRKIIIEPQFDNAAEFNNHFAVVKKNNLSGLIDEKGNVVVDFIYKSIDTEEHGGHRIASFKTEMEGLIDHKGKIILPFEYDYLEWISDKYIYAIKNEDSGILDRNGKIIIPFKYKVLWELPSVEQNAKYGVFILADYKTEKFGVIDTTGKIIIPFIYFDIDVSRCGNFRTYTGELTWDGLSKSGEIFSISGKPVFESCANPKSVSVRDTFFNNNFHYSWIDTNNVWLSPLFFSYADKFYNGYALFMTHDCLCGYVNEKFEVVIGPKYGWGGMFDEDGLAEVGKLAAVPKCCEPHWLPENYLGYIDIHGTEYWE